jgi:hypothetical protein
VNIEERIVALLRLAGNNPSEAEATAAAAKAQEMMLRHGIEMGQLNIDGEAGDVRVERQTTEGKLDPWRRTLAGAVARSAGGRFFFSQYYGKWSGEMDFFGPHGTVTSMIATYHYLERTLDTLSMQAAADFSHSYGFEHAADSMRWRRSWLLGASSRVGQRLLERLDEHSASLALVVVKSAVDRAVDDAFDNLVDDNYRVQVDPHAYREGYREGARVNLGDAELKCANRTQIP